jgi:FemAB family
MPTATDAMTMTKMCDSAADYRAEFDSVEEEGWYQILREFDDANLYQTWAYGLVTYGRRKMSHLILKKNGNVTAAAQVRFEKLPFINLGIAYVQWGPLWMVRGAEPDVETFRQAIRALRDEYVRKRGLVLRLFPKLFEEEASLLLKVLEEEGFSSCKEVRKRTILMDLNPSLEDLWAGMEGSCRRSVRLAMKYGLELLEGSEDTLFKTVVDIHKEMVSRKKFVPGSDIRQFRSMQAFLPEEFKMKVLVGRSKEGVCAGLICSAIGRTAIYLLGATSNAGMKSRGSYLLQWKLIEQLKRSGCTVYNLNGINPKRNPGTYKFKSRLAGKNGKDVYYLGRFDSRVSFFGYFCIELVDRLRVLYRNVREFAGSGGFMKWQSKAAK